MHKNSRVISAVVRAANTQLYLRGKLRLHAHNLYRANDELGDRKAEYYWKYGRTEVDWTAHQGSRDAEEGRGGGALPDAFLRSTVMVSMSCNDGRNIFMTSRLAVLQESRQTASE